MSSREIEAIKNKVKNYEDSLRKPELKILIFGPGEGNLDEYARACSDKRKQIKQLLVEKSFNAKFPEEAYEEAKRQGKEHQNITLFEIYLMEHECDIALFLYAPNCPGVEHELGVFSMHKDLVHKIYCFHPNDCELRWPVSDSLDFIRGGKGHLESFCKSDIFECHVSTKVLKIVESIRRVEGYHTHIKYKETQ